MTCSQQATMQTIWQTAQPASSVLAQVQASRCALKAEPNQMHTYLLQSQRAGWQGGLQSLPAALLADWLDPGPQVALIFWARHVQDGGWAA